MQRKEKLWTRDYCLLLLISSLLNIQNQLTGPIMSRFARDRGISLGLAGLLVGVFSVASLCARPISGRVADRVRSRLTVTVSVLPVAAAALGYGFFDANVPVLLALRFLHGIGFGASGTLLMHMASLLIPDSRMGEGMGYFGLGQVLAVAAGPGLGLYLAEGLGYGAAFTAGAALAGASAVLCLFLQAPKTQQTVKGSAEARHAPFWAGIWMPQVRGLAFMACTLFFANSIETNFIILYGEALGIGSLHNYFLVGAAAMLGVRLVGGRLMDKIGMKKVLLPAVFLVCAGLLLLSAAGLPGLRGAALPLFFTAAVVKGLGHAAAQPCIQAACIQRTPKEKRGLASGAFYMGCDLGMGLGPIIGGAVAGAAGYSALYLLGGLVALLGLWGMQERR